MNFSIPFEKITLKGNTVGDSKPAVLFLHGAGASNLARFDSFRELLARQGVSSAGLDFIGHGETGGSLESSSLKQRTEQAVAVIRELSLNQPLTIIAASMSGYTALQLTRLVEVENLIFLAPGVYAAEAYDVPFNSGFSEIIRKPDSWKDSDAWEILNSFKGNLLICTAENDQVVPKELTDMLYESAVHSHHREIYMISNATHPLGKYLEEHSADLERVIQKTVDLILT